MIEIISHILLKKRTKITFLFLLVLSILDARGQLVADFKQITLGDSCSSRAVQFDASSSQGAITSFVWEFRNLTAGTGLETGSGKNITKNFLSAGTYQVILKVSNGAQTTTKTTQLKVYQSPIVNFEATPTEGCQPLKVVFRDKSSPGDGKIVRWEWNYNDGKKDILTDADSVSTIYTSSGVFTPTLIVTNSAGCTKSLNKSNYINVYNKIVPSFNVINNFSCAAPASVTFENTSPSGPFNFIWDFGDGKKTATNSILYTHPYANYGTYSVKLTATNAPGNCSSFVQGSGAKNVYIGKPVASFALPATVCSGNALSLSPLPDPSNVTNAGKWYFEDDGAVVNAVTANHTFNKSGTWKIRYVAYNSFSRCASDTITKSIQVLPSPVANFTVDKPSGCSTPYVLAATNTSTGAVRYEWNFGDGSAVVAKTDLSSVSKSYSTYSTFPITLKAVASNGCSSQKSLSVKNSQLTLDFNYQPKEGCVPLSVKVSSNIAAGSFTYNFGNGSVVTSNAGTATSTYTSPGTFDIQVKVRTAEGCTAESGIKTVKVNEFCDTNGDTTGQGGKKNGQIYVVRDRACSKKYTFTFEDTMSTANVVSWDFDGTVVNAGTNPITYTFPQNGKKKFLVTSRLKEIGTGATIEHKIRVVIVDEKANFVPDKMNICKDITVNFKTLGIDSSNVASYTWDFGDSTSKVIIDNLALYRSTGNYSKGNTSHAYKRYGTFYTKLILKDKFGCQDSLRYPTPILVRSPVAKIKVSQTKFCESQFAVTFSSDTALSSPLKEWKWNFGDNTSATFTKDSVFSHQYINTSSFKSYKVSLVVTDSTGCSDSRDTTINSYAPQANFTTTDTLRCGKFDIRFANTSKATVTDTNQYLWLYGNGQSSIGLSGRQTFADTGIYTVSLIVKDDGGCMDTMTKKNFVKLVKPKAAFAIGGDTSKCIGTFSLPFTSSSSYAKEYIWDFGDGSISKTDKPDVSHFYKEAGSFTVKLIVSGLDGCKDSVSSVIRIKGSSEELTIEDSYLCLGETFTAVVNGKNIKSYFWDFGDLSSTAHLTQSDSVTHVYKSPGRYFPNVILVSPEGCQTTVAVKEPVFVDSIYAGRTANIECGDEFTTLKGNTFLGLAGKYVWEGPDGVTFTPDSMSVITKVNRTGLYVLRSKDYQCTMRDTVEVTRSGIVPTANAGADKRLDCIFNIAQLNGSTTTANTRFRWKGPTGAVFSPRDTSANPKVNMLGTYVLTVTQDRCTKTDTVVVTACSLVPKDTTIEICASKQGIPAKFDAYDLMTLNSYVEGGKPSFVTWFYDKLFVDSLETPDAHNLTNGDSVFAKIMSADSSEVGRAQVKFVVDTLPVAPTVFSLAPICQGFDRTLQVRGSAVSRYEWELASDSTFSADSSSTHTVRFVAGRDSVTGTVIETDSKGCKGDTGYFVVPVDLLPSKATVNGSPSDTIAYCITALEKPMLGDTPSIGYGRWRILKNTGRASLDTTLARSSIKDFTEMKDTLVAEWIVKNGVCPSNSAVLTVLPERAFTPTVSLNPVPSVCEGIRVTFRAVPGLASGNAPEYSFFDAKRRLLRARDSASTFDMVASEDTVIYVKLYSNYACLYTDTAVSNKVELKVIKKPVANIMYTADTLCVENGPVTINAEKDFLSKVTYEWYYKNKLFDKSETVKSFTYSEPKESGLYVLKTYNAICPPAYDSLKLKIYEKPIVSFSQEQVDVMYSYGKTAELPLEIQPLLFPKDISQIYWNPTDYLGTYSGSSLVFKELNPDSIVQRPLYLAQDRETTTVYWVTVRTGPEGKGCESGASVQVNNYIPVKVPNAFSPNGDGLNETWIIEGMTKYQNSKVVVFNRWGTIVYQDKNGYRVPWDGTVLGTKLAPGTYYYVIEFEGSRDDSDHNKSGSLTIVY